MTDDIREFERDFLSLYNDNPFLGGISIGISKRIDPNCKTLYIGVIPSTKEIVIGINPTFFRSLPYHQRIGVLKHELYHLCFQHLFNRKSENIKDSTAMNIAQDLAINSLIGKENLPEGTFIPGILPNDHISESLKKLLKRLKPLESTEFYFQEILKVWEEIKNDIDTNSLVDDHSIWESLNNSRSEDLKIEIQNKVKKLIEDGIKRADKASNWGNIPFSVQEEIRRQLLPKEISWKSILKIFAGTARSKERISTIKKLSKKAPGILPGIKRSTQANLAFFIDQSGSIEEKDLMYFFSELEYICYELSSIDVFNFDVTVDEDSHQIWKKGNSFSNAWLRTRKGGTNFEAIRTFILEPKNFKKWSGVVILTDGQAMPMNPIPPTIKVLWVILGTKRNQLSNQFTCNPNDLIVYVQR